MNTGYRHVLAAALILGLGAASLPAIAAAQAGADASASDHAYADPASWLCLPGREDACAVDLTTNPCRRIACSAIRTWSTPGTTT